MSKYRVCYDVNAFVDDALKVLCIDKSGLKKYEEV